MLESCPGPVCWEALVVGVGRLLLALPHPTGARAPCNPLPHPLCIPRTESRWGGPSARMFLALDTGTGVTVILRGGKSSFPGSSLPLSCSVNVASHLTRAGEV